MLDTYVQNDGPQAELDDDGNFWLRCIRLQGQVGPIVVRIEAQVQTEAGVEADGEIEAEAEAPSAAAAPAAAAAAVAAAPPAVHSGIAWWWDELAGVPM